MELPILEVFSKISSSTTDGKPIEIKLHQDVMTNASEQHTARDLLGLLLEQDQHLSGFTAHLVVCR